MSLSQCLNICGLGVWSSCLENSASQNPTSDLDAHYVCGCERIGQQLNPQDHAATGRGKEVLSLPECQCPGGGEHKSCLCKVPQASKAVKKTY